MSAEVKRFRVVTTRGLNSSWGEMDLTKDGAYVLASDYDALARQLAELRERHKRLRTAAAKLLNPSVSVPGTFTSRVVRVKDVEELDWLANWAALAAEEG